MSNLFLRQPDASLWERFMQDPAAAWGADPVLSRWARVRALGVSPESMGEPEVIEASRLAERRERVERVLRVAQPLLTRAAGSFSARNYALVVADPDGVIVERFGGGEFEPIAQKNRLIAGARWDETVRGTNAIGTAVAEQATVSVEGCAHWERRNHRLSCYASPIFDPSGQLVAVVDATSMSSASVDFAELAVATLAQGIEAQLRLHEYEASGRGTALVRTLEHLHEPAFVLEPEARVRTMNRAGQAWLSSLIGPDTLLHSLWHAAAAGQDRFELVDRALSLEPVTAQNGAMCAVLVLVGSPQRRAAPQPGAFDGLAGDDPQLHEAKARADKFARTALPCLLLAETGTGKELMARGIHAASARREGPFVALNCGALSESLLESELFGYGPGAFTGARPQGACGKLEAAEGGTLFLDEVAEMPPRLQALLLRVLEDGTFHRIGEVEARQADFRLVAATCRDLAAMVARGEFRQDLYYRIRGACIGLPALRDRTDRVVLARALLRDIAQGEPPAMDADAIAEIVRHSWPGNVRELKTALAHAYALDNRVIRAEHLPSVPSAPGPSPSRPASGGPVSMMACEAEALHAALSASDGNLSEAARQLGVARSTLYRMIRRHGRG